MNRSRLHVMVEPLREMLYQHYTIIQGYRAEGRLIVGLACDMLPIEILASFDIVPLRLPAFMACDSVSCTEVAENDINYNLYDYIIVSKRCCRSGKIKQKVHNFLEFNNPTGYGEEASVLLHEAINALLREIGFAGIEDLNKEKLAATTEEYNSLRRIVRGISTVRKEKPDLLSNDDLITIFESAQCLPLEIVIEYLSRILDRMNKENGSAVTGSVSSMVYGGILLDGIFLDRIEEMGCIIIEDDLCNGRRQFDISSNTSSEYLYYEILDAFSYRPLCSSIRNSEERFELLYKLLRNYGIDLVIFFSDGLCLKRKEQIEYLKVRLMRQGIDPLVINKKNVNSVIGGYLKKLRGIDQYVF